MQPYVMLKNVRAVLPEEADPIICSILINTETGLIEEIIRAEISSDADSLENSKIDETGADVLTITDYEGMLVFPGFIDPHVHFRYPSPTSEHSEDWLSGSLCALAAGVTTVLEMPNTNPATVDEHGLNVKLEHIKSNSLINYGIYGGLTKNNLEFLLETPEIKAVKVYLASTTGDMLIDNLPSLGVDTDKVFTFHAEDEDIINQNKNSIGHLDQPIKHSLIRSEDAAIKAVERVKQIWQNTQENSHAKFHIAHASTYGEIEVLQNTDITYEVTAHHLFCNTNDYSHGGFLWKCNPPLRDPKTQNSLYELLLDEKIPMLATDHAPHPLMAKKFSRDNLGKEPASGLPSLEIASHFLLNEMAVQRVSPVQVKNVLSTNAAERFDIQQRGEIKKGYYADLAIVDDQKIWTFEKSDIRSRCGWSPFVGREFKSKVMATIVNGCIHSQIQKTRDNDQPNLKGNIFRV